jgi:hypothetical protein
MVMAPGSPVIFPSYSVAVAKAASRVGENVAVPGMERFLEVLTKKLRRLLAEFLRLYRYS